MAEEIWKKTCEQAKALNQKFEETTGHRLVLPVVDDEPDMGEMLQLRLEQLGIEVVLFESAVASIDFIRLHSWKVIAVLSDLNMPEMDGVALRKELLKICPQVPFVVLSGFIDTDLAMNAIERKISAIFKKPLDEEELALFFQKELFQRMIALKEEQELLRGFIDDGRVLLEQLESLALELEEKPQSSELINNIFGIVHTLKGSSAFFEPKNLNQFAHKFEDLLKKIQSKQIEVTSHVVSIVLKSLDTLKSLMDQLEQREHKGVDVADLLKILDLSNVKATAQGETAEDKPGTTSTKKSNDIRVDIAILDQFLQASGEMTVIRNMIVKAALSLEKKFRTDKDVVILSELLDELHKINTQAQNRITELRKVPIKSVLKIIPRIVRDVSKNLNKDVEFKTVGDDLRVDTSVAEVLNNSIVHLVRNSFDHGIESPEVREQAGKPKRGTITITSRQKDDYIIVEIMDDGHGINSDAVRKKMVTNGLATPEQAANMPDAQVNMMIFESGFSTAQVITDLSGRGVGMSMVKTSVESIGGRINISTHKGKGTTFRLDLPIPKSVLIKNSLFVTANGFEFGIPQEQISRILLINPTNKENYLFELEGTVQLQINEHLYPIIPLSKVLFANDTTMDRDDYLIILVETSHGKKYGIAVDSLIDFEDAVVKPIEKVIKHLNVYAGATFLSNGMVGLLLDIDGIAAKSQISEFSKSDEIQNATLDENQQSSIALNYLVFELDAPGAFAVRQDQLFRLEEFTDDELTQIGGQTLKEYRGKTMTFFDLSALFIRGIGEPPKAIQRTEHQITDSQRNPTFVMYQNNHYYGFSVNKILDIVTSESDIHPPIQPKRGLIGNTVVNGKTIAIIDPIQMIEYAEFLNQQGTAADAA